MSSSFNCWRVGWQHDAENCPAVRTVFDRDLSAVHLDGPFGDGQAKTCAAVVSRSAFIQPKEAIENPLAIFGRDAWPLVRHGQNRLIRRSPYADVDGRRRRAVFDGVVEDVRDRLAQDEVNPVMSALLDNGVEVTALHNHFFWDEPRMFYMHVHGHGRPADLARKVKPALDLIGKGTSTPTAAAAAPAVSPAPTIDTAKLAQIVGTQGEQSGAVYKITIGRDDVKLTEMGAPINARMGLNTWAAFVGTNEKAAVAGDVAMLANEVQPVLKALRKNGFDVVAIHHHMTGTDPTIYFLHYWGTGPADKLATGFRAAVDLLGKGKTTASKR